MPDQTEPVAPPSPLPESPPWVRRFTATGIAFPSYARDAADSCVYTSNATGTNQLYAWDRERDRHVQLTRLTRGVWQCAIDPDGEWVWWFRDNEGDEYGQWMRQPFDGRAGAAVDEGTPRHRGPDDGMDRQAGTAGASAPQPGSDAEPAVPGLPLGFPTGVALGRTLAVVGLSTTEAGTRVYVHRYADGSTRVLYADPGYATVNALSYDETLVAIAHSEQGDAHHMAVRVLDADGAVAGDLWDGPGRGLQVVGFAPRTGDNRLLVRHERRGRWELLIWEVDAAGGTAGTGVELELDLEGDLSGRWYPDGEAVLVQQGIHGRNELYRYDLNERSLTRLPTRRGVIHGQVIRPDGTLEYQHSSGGSPPALLSENGATLLTPKRPAPPSVELTDAWVDGPAGPIHALVARPPARSQPGPARPPNGLGSGHGPRSGPVGAPVATVFWLHGGPGGMMSHGFYAVRAAFVDAGYAVIHVNYRGSSGYGSTWRDADRVQPGLVELEDIAAVRAWAVESGIADPDRCVITGKSWGGYLTLLGLGTQPDLWAAGIGDVPIGDMVALYEDEMEPVRQYDRALFGGSPEELPEKWAKSSPITYADKVRAPLLVIASRNDPRCPIRSVENFLARLDDSGVPYEADFFEAGHFSLVANEEVRQMKVQLDFLARHVPA